ncbi:MAG: hypothetical protein RL728_376 [Bacteroidota bacterium]|jgi:hypothetical protein
MMNYKMLNKILLVLPLVLVITGTIFKIKHWPFATLMLILGQITMVFAFFYLLIKWTKKSQTNNSHTN